MQLNKITSVIMLSASSLIFGCGDSGGGESEKPSSDGTNASIPAGHTISDAEADKRAKILLAQMTMDQKIQLVHGHGMPNMFNGYPGITFEKPPENALPDAVSFIPGIKALGIPDNNIVDSGSGPNVPGQNVTALPSPISVAASWDLDLAKRIGERVGLESRTLGFATALGGHGVNLTRDPRNGRVFEYMGEDPVLAGELTASRIIGTQSMQVMTSLKHYAMNGSETDRFVSNSVVDEQTMRETELLGFEIAIEKGKPAYVMCSYNRVNGTYACENEYLLNDVLKKEWKFQGMVQSDWGAQHSTIAAANTGMDEEQPGIERDASAIPSNLRIFFGGGWFAQRLADAVADGRVPMSRLDDMVFRKLRSMIATGVMDNPPPARQQIDQASGNIDAYKLAADSIVLLKNSSIKNDNQAPLPLTNMTGKKIAVIGLNADKGVLGGGGSGAAPVYYESQVTDCDTNPASIYANCPVFMGVTPVEALKAKFPNSQISYYNGENTNEAVTAADNADVTIVFAGVWGNEASDNMDLSLANPDNDKTGIFKYNQDDLIAAVATKAKKTVVVLENGSAVKMPWVSEVDAILETWYPGVQGANAIADVLSGDVNPSAKLPITFPVDEDDLVMPKLPTNVGNLTGMGLIFLDLEKIFKPQYDSQFGEGAYDKLIAVNYDEKLLSNGYKWMDSKDIEPLFHFGHGLSYTSFKYSDALSEVNNDGSVTVSINITNTGGRFGQEIAQVYASLPDNVPGHKQPKKKLVGWKKVGIMPNETKTVKVNVPRKYLSTWDAAQTKKWLFTPGEYVFSVSDSADTKSANTLTTSLNIVAQ
ncbi:beta-glucosidase [Aeromonas hydrophila]